MEVSAEELGTNLIDSIEISQARNQDLVPVTPYYLERTKRISHKYWVHHTLRSRRVEDYQFQFKLKNS